MFIYHVSPHTHTLVFGDARNRHNEITLERVGNMSHVFTDNPQHVCGFAYVICYMKAWLAVLCFEVERYFYM